MVAVPRAVEDLAWAGWRAVAPAVPSWRARRAYLRGLTLDLGPLGSPLPAPGPDDVVLCGVPRSGTTLLTAALHQPPRAVALVEPWLGLVLPPAELFAEVRRRLRHDGAIGGRLDLDRLRAEGSTDWVEDRARPVEPRPDADSVLVGIKWPTYWQLLPHLPDTRFVVCVRHPHKVVASMVGARGDLRDGLDHEIPFNAGVNAELRRATRWRAERRALLYERIVAGILPHLERPNVFLVRYERWSTDAPRLLAELSDFLGVDLTEPLVRLDRGPGRPPRLTRRDRAAVAALCPSARALGYEVDR